MQTKPSRRHTIIELIASEGSATSPELAQQLNLTRQAVNYHIRQLLDEQILVKTGSTRSARYYIAGRQPNALTAERHYNRNCKLPSLEESKIYDEAALSLNLPRLRDNVDAITHYAFTEMLNNAIDHSEAGDCQIKFKVTQSHVTFQIRDKGVGVFASIAQKLGYSDESEAMIELLKGKTTTMPEAHTGEGLFFTARAADRFLLRSHRTQVEWVRRLNDVFVSSPRRIEGTHVYFEIGTNARTRLDKVFGEFAPAHYDYQFERTHVRVRLLKNRYVSRSEAKRLMHGLEKFREVTLDMKKVDTVGQGFADEVFRVFTNKHPNTQVTPVGAKVAVAAMLKHASAFM